MPEVDTPIRTKEAADLLDIASVKQFLRVMAREGIQPAVAVPGVRGAKFWNRADLVPLIPAVASPENVATADPSPASAIPDLADAGRSSASAA